MPLKHMNMNLNMLAILPVLGGGIIGALALVFWIWMLVDCIQNDRLASNEKIIWVLVIIFCNCLGALLYMLLARKK